MNRQLGPRMNRMAARGFRLLMPMDAIVLYASMLTINFARFGTEWPSFPISHYLIGFGIATVIQIGIAYLSGLYQREPRLGRRPWLPRVALVVIVGVTIDGFAFILLNRFLMPRLNLFVLAIVATILLTSNRYISRLLYNRRMGPARVLLVGDDAECDRAVKHLGEGDDQAIVVARSSDTTSLLDDVASWDATDVLLLDEAAYADIFPDPINDLEQAGVGVFQRVSAAQTLLGLHEIREVGGMPFVALRARSLPPYKYRLKRALDLVVVVIGAPIVLLVIGLTAIWVRLRAGSPVLYRQVRVGRGGEPFEMIKFRTMRPDAEADGAVLSSDADPRVIRGLGWMRGTRLDETPQLLHVVSGQMSIVGPRPERPEFTEALARTVPGYERRFELPPGLTGLAQINGRYSTDASYKIGYDLQYVADWTLLGDVQIMLRTIWVVVSRRV